MMITMNTTKNVTYLKKHSCIENYAETNSEDDDDDDSEEIIGKKPEDRTYVDAQIPQIKKRDQKEGYKTS